MPVSHWYIKNLLQETGILTFSAKKTRENYKSILASKCNLNNSLGLYLRPGVYFLWDPENPRLIIKTDIYLDATSIRGKYGTYYSQKKSNELQITC